MLVARVDEMSETIREDTIPVRKPRFTTVSPASNFELFN